jgi:DHA2 family multidrug resistance protein
VVGRLITRVVIRLILFIGLAVTTYSLYQMTGYSLDMDWWPIVSAGIVQGIGLGFLFVPLSAVAFATLPSELRPEGAGIFSLVRNIGGSIGISMVETLEDRLTQTVHASLAPQVTPFSSALHLPGIQHFWNTQTPAGLAALNQEITRQASMIAYLDNFKLMMVICMIAVPLLLLLRKGRQGPSRGPVMD